MKMIFLLLVFCVPVFGQPIGERVKSVEEQLKTRFPKEAKFFTIDYDKFKDETSIDTYIRFRYPKAKVSVLQCNIKARFTGQIVDKDIEDFYFICSPRLGIGSSWQFLRSNKLIFLLDGERLDLGSGKHDGVVRSGGVREWVIYSVTRDALRAIAQAKEIEIQMGTFEGFMEKDGHPRIEAFLTLTDR